MLKLIAESSAELLDFIENLDLPLSVPQKRHVLQIADALITTEGRKDLSNLYRHIVDDPCPKSAADTFREAPWQDNDIRNPLQHRLVSAALELAEAEGISTSTPIFFSLDDSLTEKDQHSKRLENVDWHHDHTRSFPDNDVFVKGAVYVMLRLTIGPISFTLDMRPYLRASTVRRLNKDRAEDEQLTYLTKLEIAREMLDAVVSLLPADRRVYVLFDSWYASAALIKWCRAQDWHVICRLKSNRKLNGTRVKDHHQRLKHQRYTRVRVPAADEADTRRYLVRSVTGKLSSLPDQVRVFMSKRHHKDRWVRYYLCTDPTLSAQEALNFYHIRWGCEVANWYIVERLGWADSRLWRFESSHKFMMVLWLALAFLELRTMQEPRFRNLADVIRTHRQMHAHTLLQQACAMALNVGDVQPVLARFTVPLPTT